jgi:hypothetical protein
MTCRFLLGFTDVLLSGSRLLVTMMLPASTVLVRRGPIGDGASPFLTSDSAGTVRIWCCGRRRVLAEWTEPLCLRAPLRLSDLAALVRPRSTSLELPAAAPHCGGVVLRPSGSTKLCDIA